jgi:membrane protein YqaA with SNARE-associated domain
MLNALIFTWAFAEATIWPLMPEALLVPLAVLQPLRAVAHLPSAIAGSACGGILNYTVTRNLKSSSFLRHIPLVRPSMIGQCQQWLAIEGTSGVRHQPTSMLPFKVFAAVAGEMKLPLLSFIAKATLVRAARFALATAISAAFGFAFAQMIAAHPCAFICLWSCAFAAALFAMDRTWRKRCATTHGAQQKLRARWDSNPGPSASETDALSS